MKTKPKIAKKNRPNPFLHMLLWGFGSGTLFAALYYIFISGLYGASTAAVIWVLAEPLFWLAALIIGGASGVVLGLVAGFLLWQLLRKQIMPFTPVDMLNISGLIYVSIGLTTLLGAYLLIALFHDLLNDITPTLLIYIPPFIAAVLSCYAAHRYLFRLRLWSEKAYGQEKAKHSARLEDKPKTDTIELEEAEEIKQEQSL